MYTYLLAMFMLTQNQAKAKPQPPVAVSNLIFIEELLNDKCRGGAGDNPDTQRACDIRDSIDAEIQKHGWCWGHAGQIEADKDWEPCPVKHQ